MTRFSIAVVLAVVIGCSSPGATHNDTIAWPDTMDTEWVVTSIGGSPIVSGTRVTLRTSPGGIGGHSGCNWYGLRPDSGRSLVEMTARGCRSDIQDQERRFTSLLPRAVRAVRRGDTLRLIDSVPSELITLVLRRPTGSAVSALGGSDWRLAAATSRFIDTDSVVIRFARDSVNGFGGCRQFEGTYGTRRPPPRDLPVHAPARLRLRA
jgi:heat shock protein HslJ